MGLIKYIIIIIIIINKIGAFIAGLVRDVACSYANPFLLGTGSAVTGLLILELNSVYRLTCQRPETGEQSVNRSHLCNIKLYPVHLDRITEWSTKV